VVERHIFNTRKQGPSEKVDTFITDLRILAKSCEFENLHDSLIHDRIVCGVNSDTFRGRLLRESDLTLQRSIDICRAAEPSSSQLHVPSTGGTEASINFVRKGGKVTKVDKQKHANCCKCGRKHEIRNRPAFGKQCHKCKGKQYTDTFQSFSDFPFVSTELMQNSFSLSLVPGSIACTCGFLRVLHILEK
jgi:hypothetical protein